MIYVVYTHDSSQSAIPYRSDEAKAMASFESRRQIESFPSMASAKRWIKNQQTMNLKNPEEAQVVIHELRDSDRGLVKTFVNRSR